jgi:ornithine carbamoyltransferase
MLENKKDFLDTVDFSKQTLLKIIELGSRMKKNKAKYSSALKNKKLGLIFEKSSTRTRVSFEAGIYELGGIAMFLSSRDIQIGRGEPIKDTAKILSRYLDAVMIRTFKQEDVEEFSKEASIPVINGLTDLLHPCQAMADFQTILEKKGRIEEIRLAFIGDGHNMANSLGLLASALGAHFSFASPKNYEISPEIKQKILEKAKASGSQVLFSNDPSEAVKDADIVYTDVWTSMDQEKEKLERLSHFQGFQVNEELVRNAKKDFHFMHCLPAHRGEEVSAGIMDGPHSIVVDQAENRLHVQKAILALLMK